ncbi:hypothetical protein [Arthrobacter antibioticus]|uniref:hypothetical protein n=1 Tax=Arthrobacter sp. H35-MC1 TaxID=3046203 RepID=UPI0024BBDFE1|nr:hypothetical protein [Arthrobacter sp. H35-MC1]MDJ0316038.1 hypothetical protein [Arthrobacter sp. H35-MC1]
MEDVADFSGLLVSITPNRARGIYDEDTFSDSIFDTVKEYFNSRGIQLLRGYRPGIGAAVGPSKFLEWLLRSIPMVGKLLMAGFSLGRLVNQKIISYRKKKLRPFEPTIGIHLDIWPRSGLRSRTDSGDLADTLLQLPMLASKISHSHHNILATFLLTSNGNQIQLPPVRVDADVCSEATMVRLATVIAKGMASPTPYTHYIVTKRWGIRPKISRYRDSSAAFHTVFLFPDGPA